MIYGNLCHTAQTYSRACTRMCIKIIYEDVTMGDVVTYECFVEFAVRGHHVYKAIWNPVICETCLIAAAFIQGRCL